MPDGFAHRQAPSLYMEEPFNASGSRVPRVHPPHGPAPLTPLNLISKVRFTCCTGFGVFPPSGAHGDRSLHIWLFPTTLHSKPTLSLLQSKGPRVMRVVFLDVSTKDSSSPEFVGARSNPSTFPVTVPRRFFLWTQSWVLTPPARHLPCQSVSGRNSPG